jgi:hypothetical protein
VSPLTLLWARSTTACPAGLIPLRAGGALRAYMCRRCAVKNVKRSTLSGRCPDALACRGGGRGSLLPASYSAGGSKASSNICEACKAVDEIHDVHRSRTEESVGD